MKDLIYPLSAAGLFALDQRMKNRVEKTMGGQEKKPILKGRVILRRSHNYGAFLNLGEKKSQLVRILSVGVTAAAAALFVCTLTRKGNGLAKAGLSLLLGGAFSNSYDRLFRKYVVDYFSFSTGIGALDRVVFNLADFGIVIGAVCTALTAL